MTLKSLSLKVGAAGFALAGALVIANGAAARHEDPPSAARGKYLVTAMGCNDCHTPWSVGPDGPAPDMTRMLSGHPQGEVMLVPQLHPGQWASAPTNTAFLGPWGTSYTANLTPDETGLGSWTEDMFLQAIRTGRHMGQARPILPPMPWPMIRNLTDDDLRSIFAYLRTIPPIQNRVPQPLAPAIEEGS
ncbi:MAG TPA: c-type cytochrome [Planctomycetota bacterium]